MLESKGLIDTCLSGDFLIKILPLQAMKQGDGRCFWKYLIFFDISVIPSSFCLCVKRRRIFIAFFTDDSKYFSLMLVLQSSRHCRTIASFFSVLLIQKSFLPHSPLFFISCLMLMELIRFVEPVMFTAATTLLCSLKMGAPIPMIPFWNS